MAADPNPIIGTMALGSVRPRRYESDSPNLDEKIPIFLVRRRHRPRHRLLCSFVIATMGGEVMTKLISSLALLAMMLCLTDVQAKDVMAIGVGPIGLAASRR